MPQRNYDNCYIGNFNKIKVSVQNFDVLRYAQAYAVILQMMSLPKLLIKK